MKVVIAPDKFKGSASAAEVAASLRAGLLRRRPDLDVVMLPMADGGEGTVDAALAAGYETRWGDVHGPLGEPRRARFALSSDGVAVIEMALASGLAFTRADDDAARRASSRGTGELVAAALAGGARRVVVGAGGSASTDGGAGAVAALGASLVGAAGGPIDDGGAALAGLTRVDLDGLDARLATTELVVASDVDNPLLGPEGAAAVFGPQKGASPATVAELELGLQTWVARLSEASDAAVGLEARPGAGAAGGLGYGLMLLGARRRAGVEVVTELVGLDEAVRGADLVLTGEGSLDGQSLRGKTPLGVARAAAGVPVVAVAGRAEVTLTQLRPHGFVGVHALTDLEPDVARCLTHAPSLLQDLGERIATEYLEA